MTGAQTDRVHIPQYVRAGAVLVALSGKLFTLATDANRQIINGEAFEYWKIVRRAIASIWHMRSTNFDDLERGELFAALNAAHTLSHPEPAAEIPHPERCRCAIALHIVDFSLIMALGEVKKASVAA